MSFLATEDAALEEVVRAAVNGLDCEFNFVTSKREGVCLLVDGSRYQSLRQDIAVVDLDLNDGARTLLRTAGGSIPVIAIASKPGSWLSSLARHHRVGATLTKPVSSDRLRDAFQNVGHISLPAETREAEIQT